MNPRPLSVSILAWVYIAVGITSAVYHLTEFRAGSALQFSQSALIELVGLSAIIAGTFMLRGRDWARWLALAWIAFHLVVSAFHSLQQFAMHALFCAVIAWFLFRPAARRYFRGAP